ncbi:hypothetical protein Fcan01_08156 [Folsomia candida]|uniref:Uncharacterized protein n=1 Tax=Folsomia candida TaxID=158441 RepID=A0A226EL69_FOLCA|nr:hypothetical protein Fcan01_08156 [Folsomia candida]
MKQQNPSSSSVESGGFLRGKGGGSARIRSTTPVPGPSSSSLQPNPVRSYRLVKMPPITFPCIVEGWLYVHAHNKQMSIHAKIHLILRIIVLRCRSRNCDLSEVLMPNVV